MNSPTSLWISPIHSLLPECKFQNVHGVIAFLSSSLNYLKVYPPIHIFQVPTQSCCSWSHLQPLDPHLLESDWWEDSCDFLCTLNSLHTPKPLHSVLSVQNFFPSCLLDELLFTIQDPAPISPGFPDAQACIPALGFHKPIPGHLTQIPSFHCENLFLCVILTTLWPPGGQRLVAGWSPWFPCLTLYLGEASSTWFSTSAQWARLQVTCVHASPAQDRMPCSGADGGCSSSSNEDPLLATPSGRGFGGKWGAGLKKPALPLIWWCPWQLGRPTLVGAVPCLFICFSLRKKRSEYSGRIFMFI